MISEKELAKFFAIIGVFVLIIGLIQSNKYSKYIPTRATVVECKRYTSTDSTHDYRVTVQYKVGEKLYQSLFDSTNKHKKGTTTTVIYNPDNPLELAGGKKNGAHVIALFGLGMTIACILYSIFK